MKRSFGFERGKNLSLFYKAVFAGCFKLVAGCLVGTVWFSNATAQNAKPIGENSRLEKRIDSLIRLMTLKEKLNVVHGNSMFTSAGVPRLNLPGLVMSDGPHGVRMDLNPDFSVVGKGDDSVSYLPVGIALAATWNRQLGYLHGQVLGKEANARGKDAILGPGINIIRTPLNGRNFEYMSEDPYLVSQMAVGYINGVQSTGVSACVKHFVANNQETGRDWVNVEMTERALQEIYLPAFKASVQQSKVMMVMGAYNKFRGQYCTHNHYLVNELLKKQWGFKGALVSDWGAVHNTGEAMLNGTDLEMGSELQPGIKHSSQFYLADAAEKMIKKGAVSETLLDDKVRRVLRVLLYTKKYEGRQKGAVNSPEHRKVAATIAEESIVLLKNEKSTLPLAKKQIKQIAVIGVNAATLQARGGGSSQVQALYEITPLQGLQTFAKINGISVRYAPGYKVQRGENMPDEQLLQEAVDLAKKADVVVFVGGTNHGYDYSKWDERGYDHEGIDKPDMQLPFGQAELLHALAKVNPKTIAVLMGGGAVAMQSWHQLIPSILQTWYGGMEGGNALVNVLFGLVNPSGKLPVTFPQKLQDVAAHSLGEYPGDSLHLRYNEGIYVGYRHFDKRNIIPQFPFGHGLSYTSFTIPAATVKKSGKSYLVTMSIKNTGNREGKEVVQLYVRKKNSSIDRPEKELKGFEKIYLKPGETKTVTIMLGTEAFQYFDEKLGQWHHESGDHEILIGTSSRNIVQRLSLRLP